MKINYDRRTRAGAQSLAASLDLSERARKYFCLNLHPDELEQFAEVSLLFDLDTFKGQPLQEHFQSTFRF